MIEDKQVSLCTHIKIKNTCKVCGLYLHDNKPIKTNRFITNSHITSQLYLKQIRKRVAQPCPQAKQLPYQVSLLLQSICEKFQFGLETYSLALYLHAYLQTHKTHQIPQSDSLHTNEKFIASACLIVAAKAIQLDKKVPYLNRFQRYAQKQKTKEEYQAQQRSIFQAMNFQLQYSTFITFINFYLTVGIVFQSDELGDFSVYQVQDDVCNRARQLINKGDFVKFNHENVAVQIIQQARKKFKLTPWPQELQTFSAIKSSTSIISVKEEFILQPLKSSLKDDNCPKSIDMKYITIRNKKKELFKPSTIKQNSFKEIPQFPSYSGLTKSMSVLKTYNSYSIGNINYFANLLGNRKKI